MSGKHIKCLTLVSVKLIKFLIMDDDGVKNILSNAKMQRERESERGRERERDMGEWKIKKIKN